MCINSNLCGRKPEALPFIDHLLPATFTKQKTIGVGNSNYKVARTSTRQLDSFRLGRDPVSRMKIAPRVIEAFASTTLSFWDTTTENQYGPIIEYVRPRTVTSGPSEVSVRSSAHTIAAMQLHLNQNSPWYVPNKRPFY